MSEIFKISVIIPVYNAERFLIKAVNSALQLEEVGEIILVEDGSPDNALQICKDLVEKYDKIKLFQHTNGENKGAAASRNLGIFNASFNYIAFLDADDYYLPNRFVKEKEVFDQHKGADGVYNAVGIFIDSFDEHENFTITKNISPKKLFYHLLRGNYGHFHTNGITVKKTLFAKSGYFRSELKLHQDSDLWLKFAFHGKLYPGELNVPVAMVRRHDKNRITSADYHSKLLYWSSVNEYFSIWKIRIIEKFLILRKIAKIRAKITQSSWIYTFFLILMRK